MANRLYYSDAFLKSFNATVTDIREVSRTEGQSLWQVALDRTAFYPATGGQPYDLGTLTATSRGGAVLEVPIESIEEDEAGEVWHFVRKPLLSGTVVEGTIDWQRRLDHMQQHSGQHLLSAVFAHELKAPTVSFHLGETVSTIDIASGALAHHSLERVEQIANTLIAENRTVNIQTVPREKAEALLTEGKLSKLPERDGTIRLIEIENYDLNACGGTHVRSTGQIGGLLIRGVEKVSRGFRISFVCGLRAVRAAREDFTRLSQAASTLSIGAADLPAALDRIQATAKTAEKDRLKLREELATYHAARLAVEEPIQHGLRLVQRTYPDRDRDYIRLLASRLTASVPQTVALISTTENDPARIVLARSQDLDFDCGSLLKEALAELGLRGGGSRDLAQGEVPHAQLDTFIASVATAVKATTLTAARR